MGASPVLPDHNCEYHGFEQSPRMFLNLQNIAPKLIKGITDVYGLEAELWDGDGSPATTKVFA